LSDKGSLPYGKRVGGTIKSTQGTRSDDFDRESERLGKLTRMGKLNQSRLIPVFNKKEVD
jgi:hypothetical protein